MLLEDELLRKQRQAKISRGGVENGLKASKDETRDNNKES